ncbi:MAG: hypothetical protein JO224_12190 [Pelomonas sp.]|nr:hypothetical protein [Roseateles sp.]
MTAAAADLGRLQALVEARLGLLVHAHQLDNLAATAAAALARFGSADVHALCAAFAAARDGDALLEFFIERLTVGESFFFRDTAQMDALRDELIPRLVEQRRHGARALRVWSAACSAGQELYSVALLITDALGGAAAARRDWRLHLVGTDINAAALRRAEAGEYTNWSLRGVDAARRERCFEAAPGGGVRLRAELRALATFRYLNLAAGGFPSIVDGLHDFDVILCRNVFVYFDPARARRILARMTQALAPDGVLLLGASDIVDPHIDGLVTVQRGAMCYYRKPLLAVELQPPVPAAPPAAFAVSNPSAAAAPPEAPTPAAAPAWADLDALAAAGRWADVAARAASAGAAPPDAAAARLLALALGNLGRQEEALACCTQALERAPTDPALHFLRALLSAERGDDAAALDAFRRTLYLAPDNIEAHHQMALLLLRTGQQARGLRSLRNALELARREPGAAPAPGGLSYARLAAIIANEMELHAQVEANG